MIEFEVAFASAAARDLDDVEVSFGRHLAANPFPRGKLIKRLRGFRVPTYELRVQSGGRSYRVVCRIEGRRVIVLMIPPRALLERHLRRLG